MSDEPTERDVEALAHLIGAGLTQGDWLAKIARTILASDWYAERIAQARREGAAGAASSGYFRGYHDCRDGMQFRDPWRDHVPGAGI